MDKDDDVRQAVVGNGSTPIELLSKMAEQDIVRTGMASSERSSSGEKKICIDIRHTLWELEHGPKPKGASLMFCPDKQHCINPEHQTLRESEDPVARFMRKVKKLPGENGCWIWKGTTRRLNKRSLPYFSTRRARPA
ncbi:MAG: hypothetical protein IIT36_02630 [Aeriscardovia sp.]|nr:hypothetical protein [Aeriscardovia sp.]